MKKKFMQFLLGCTTGIFIFTVIVLCVWGSYKIGFPIVNILESRLFKKDITEKIVIPDSFMVSFERESDLKLFKAERAAIDLSHKFSTDGEKSLMVEFPAGMETAAFFFEVFGKYAMDWEDMDYFSLDITNSAYIPASLILKIKSGKQYPKKSFEKPLTLPPLQTTRVVIKKPELRNKLDLKSISYINFFMQDPTTTFRIYFDNMRVVKNE